MPISPVHIVITDLRDPEFFKSPPPESLSQVPVRWSINQLTGDSDDEVADACRDADAVIVDLVPMHQGILKRLHRTRLIIRHGAGYDNIDVKEAAARGIAVSAFPDYCTEDVAEHAVALILSLNRKLAILNRAARNRRWGHEDAIPIRPLAGKTLGLIGCGRIGSRVFMRMKGFGMRCLACDPYVPKTLEKELGMKLVDRETLLGESDVVSIHAPLTAETRHMINRTGFARMKQSGFLVNTARGAIIDSGDLIEALKNRAIAGAAVDVFDPEPPFQLNGLFDIDNLFITPHSAWYSEESIRRINQMMMQELHLFVQGHPLRYRVHPNTE
jgi:D-3-phosphoglycerate dehydrogenase / 2-oxoglutarate reductase